MDQRPIIPLRPCSYVPIYVSLLTSERHPAPPDSRTALFILPDIPRHPLEVGLRVRLYLHLPQPGRGPCPPGANSSTAELDVAGSIVGQRACERDEVEFVVRNDDRGGRIQRAFVRVRVIPGVSANLDIGRSLARRLESLPSQAQLLVSDTLPLDPLMPSPQPSYAPELQRVAPPDLRMRSHTGCDSLVPATRYHPELSSLARATYPPEEPQTIPPPPRLPYRVPTPPWRATPPSPACGSVVSGSLLRLGDEVGGVKTGERGARDGPSRFS